MTACVVALGRRENFGRVVRQWAAQTIATELILVPKVACFLEPWAVELFDLKSARMLEPVVTIGGARNAGKAEARRRGHAWVVQLDDDNYYGPRYVEQIHAHRGEGDVLTQGIAFVRHEDGLAYYGNPVDFAPAHATAFRVGAEPDFPEVSLAEDVLWSKRLKHKPVLLPPWHAVYERRGRGHAYDAREAEFRFQFGPALEFGDVPDTFVDTPRELEGPRVAVDMERLYADFREETRELAARAQR